MVEAELFLELLVGLLAYPPGFDGTGQLFERRVAGQIAEIVFTLAGGAMLTDQPDLFAGKMLLAKVTDTLRRPVSDPHAHGSKPRRELAFVPRRQLTVCHFALSSISWAGRERTSGTWFLRGRPRPVTGKIMATSAGYTSAYKGCLPPRSGRAP